MLNFFPTGIEDEFAIFYTLPPYFLPGIALIHEKLISIWKMKYHYHDYHHDFP